LLSRVIDPQSGSQLVGTSPLLGFFVKVYWEGLLRQREARSRLECFYNDNMVPGFANSFLRSELQTADLTLQKF